MDSKAGKVSKMSEAPVCQNSHVEMECLVDHCHGSHDVCDDYFFLRCDDM
jgi:hypothetical protein